MIHCLFSGPPAKAPPRRIDPIEAQHVLAMGFSPALVQAAFDETGPAGTRQDAMDWLLDNASNYSPPVGLGKGIELIVANDELDKIRKQDARKKSARLAEGATDTKETLRVEVKSGWLHKHNRLGWGQRWFVLDYAPSDNSLRMRYWHSRPGKYGDIEKGEEKGTEMLLNWIHVY